MHSAIHTPPLRTTLSTALPALLTVVLFLAVLAVGSVSIPIGKVFAALAGNLDPSSTEAIIVLESRLPSAVGALLAGAALSAAGLLLQTTFQNPLAGPSLLGVSSGSSLGVALVMLGASGMVWFQSPAAKYFTAVTGALAGAAAVIALLLAFSQSLRSPVMLLVVGVMMSYMASSCISLLNFFAPADDVKQFVVWGLGSFTSITPGQLPVIIVATLVCLALCIPLAKPLDALLLGERYAASMGYSVRRLRSILLTLSGVLTAIVTAFCGPIGFVGLIVPHIARMTAATSSHHILIPSTMLWGSAVMLLCALLSAIPSGFGVLPVNVVTPVLGVPVILYIILFRRKLNYLN